MRKGFGLVTLVPSGRHISRDVQRIPSYNKHVLWLRARLTVGKWVMREYKRFPRDLLLVLYLHTASLN